MGERSGKIRAQARPLSWFRENVPCLWACPVKTDAGRYVQMVAEGRLEEAYRIARAPNPIASICGRACGAPCEDACRRGKIDKAVSIRPLKRFLTERFGPESFTPLASAEIAASPSASGSTTPGHSSALIRQRALGSVHRVAVVGSGPAGLACAHDLALLGHRVSIFEAMPQPGGMLRYGIPEYRLPREVIERQVAELAALGVEIRLSTPISAEFGLRALKAAGFEAIFLAVGAGKGRSLRLPGSDLDGVVKAVDFLLNVNRGYRIHLGRKVVVIGGGLVALDAARTAVREMLERGGHPSEIGAVVSSEEDEAVASSGMRLALDAAREARRLGAIAVTVVSLESLEEMPAMKSLQGREEMETTAEEGIAFLPSWGPEEILGQGGRVSGVRFVRCTRVFDEEGRFSPEFDRAVTRTLQADTVLLAIGQSPDLGFLSPEDGIETTPWGGIKVDPQTLATSAEGVWAGGDGAFPPGLLISVAEHGKRAARQIDAYLRRRPPRAPKLKVHIEELRTATYEMPPDYDKEERFIPVVPIDRRTGITEVEQSYQEEEARRQAKRCLVCHVHPIYNSDLCVLCGRCADVCPHYCIRFAPLSEVELSLEDRERVERLPSAEAAGSGPRSAFLYAEEKCIRCGLCAMRCPTGAITMERFSFYEEAV